MNEPRIHSHITSSLPDSHPLAYEMVICYSCGAILHNESNLCMNTWVETGKGSFCIKCFNYQHLSDGETMDGSWSLPRSGQVNVVPECDHIWIDASNEHVSGTAMCVRCTALEILANVELSKDKDLINDLLVSRGLKPRNPRILEHPQGDGEPS